MKTKNTGFSLLAVVGILASISITLGALAPVFVQQIQMEHAKKAVREMRVIQDSGKEYFAENGSFPGNLQDLKDAGYLKDDWNCKDPWGRTYQVSTTADTFSVVANGIPQKHHGIASASLPFVNISGNQITSSVPIPGREAGMDSIVHLSGTDDKRTMSATLRARSVNTQTYYFDLESGMMRMNDWYVQDMSCKEDGSNPGLWISKYPENVRISIEREE